MLLKSTLVALGAAALIAIPAVVSAHPVGYGDDYAAERPPPTVLVWGSCQRCCQASNPAHRYRSLMPYDRANLRICSGIEGVLNLPLCLLRV